jgi:asparagine synthase (glutamine-hydrolysing)
LSGGIDSSLITHYAKEVNPKLKTFSLGYREKDFDETSFAETCAKYFKTDHHSFKVSSEELRDLAHTLITNFDLPHGDPTILPTLFLAKYSSIYVKVALSGDGGDELFTGYPHQAALYRLSFFTHFPKWIRDLSTPELLGKISILMQFSNKAEWLENFIGILGPLPENRQRNILIKVQEKDSIVQKILDETSMRKLDWFHQVEQVYLKTFLPDTVLHKTDRATMAYGLEARVPFLDDEMVSFAGMLNREQKLHFQKSKAILRNLLKSKIDQGLHQRKKQGFSIPLKEWYNGPWKSWLSETLNEKKIIEQNILNIDEIKKILNEHEKGIYNHSHLMWCLMSFQLWYDQHLLVRKFE